MVKRYRVPFGLSLLFTLGLASADAQNLYVGANLSYSAVDSVAATELGRVFGVPREVSPGLFFATLDQIGFNEAAFDDDDTAWGLVIGYELSRFLSIEFGYDKLGRFPPENRPGSSPVRYRSASLAISDVSARGKFQYPFGDTFALNGWIGVTRSSFDADGVGEVAFLIPDVLAAFTNPVTVSDPSNETGFLWGFGGEWAFTERASIGVNYTRRDSRVVEIEALGLQLIYAL